MNRFFRFSIDMANILKPTRVFGWNLKAFNEGKRYIVNQGGTSSSKTYSILQLLFLIALYNDGLTISVVSESVPHLKKGALDNTLSGNCFLAFVIS